MCKLFYIYPKFAALPYRVSGIKKNHRRIGLKLAHALLLLIDRKFYQDDILKHPADCFLPKQGGKNEYQKAISKN